MSAPVIGPLKIVLGQHGQVADIRNGLCPIRGVELDFITVKRMPDAYREMVQSQPYDISELAPTTYLMALECGAPITALPIPMTRRFRHAGLMRRVDGDIRYPKDLEGKRVGVRTNSLTASVWTRGVLSDDFGVDLQRITWVTEEPENIANGTPHANVEMLPEGRSLAQEMREGRLAAGMAGLAGLGDDPGVDLVDVVEDAAEREADFFRRTGVYPIHGVVAVKNSVLEQYPDFGARVFEAFSTAKANYWTRVQRGDLRGPDDLRYLKLAELVGDPLPYGLEENRASFEALVRYARRLNLIGDIPPIERLFPDPRTANQPCARWR
jgi:4,5-dihydroxyphthalate decarboxylase